MKNLKRFFVFFLLISCVLFYIHWSRLSHGEMIVYFLDVGQGDSVLIKTPSDKIILIDGGPETEVMSELNAVLPFFKKNIDLLVLTHPHDDHIQGLVSVTARYQIDSALITGVDYDNAYYDEFLSNLREDRTDVYFADEGTDFSFDDGVFVDVLYPFESISGESFSDINDSSIVMRITYGSGAVLLAGDCTEKIESQLLNHGLLLDSDIFKASHHGSKYSNSLPFLQVVSPNTVVISVGENDFGHPTEEAIMNFEEVGAEIFRTDEDGRVVVGRKS
ncbi:MAG: MBL fold metallo-hydrolase [Candidatus Gracilibacteria bacterium]|jgi:competence protein ComEC